MSSHVSRVLNHSRKDLKTRCQEERSVDCFLTLNRLNNDGNDEVRFKEESKSIRYLETLLAHSCSLSHIIHQHMLEKKLEEFPSKGFRVFLT
jgi:hypothetical protein